MVVVAYMPEKETNTSRPSAIYFLQLASSYMWNCVPDALKTRTELELRTATAGGSSSIPSHFRGRGCQTFYNFPGTDWLSLLCCQVRIFVFTLEDGCPKSTCSVWARSGSCQSPGKVSPSSCSLWRLCRTPWRSCPWWSLKKKSRETRF